MSKTRIARLAENLNEIPPLFTSLKLIVFEIASLAAIVYWLWKHL